MNVAKRNFRRRIRNEDNLQYAAVYIFNEMIAVTKYPMEYSPMDVFINNKRIIPFHEWIINSIDKSEYDTLIVFGVPFVPTTYIRAVYLDSITKKNNVLA